VRERCVGTAEMGGQEAGDIAGDIAGEDVSTEHVVDKYSTVVLFCILQPLVSEEGDARLPGRRLMILALA